MVAVDFSDTTMPIIDLVLRYHKTFQPEFVILHVLTQSVVKNLKRTSSLDTTKAQSFVIEEISPLLARVEKELDTYEVNYKKDFRQGVPHKTIARAADDLECDLIIMGCHNRMGIAELFIGNTAKNMLDETHIPIILVKPAKRSKKD